MHFHTGVFKVNMINKEGILCLLLILHCLHYQVVKSIEYCHFEKFEPACQSDEVIVMDYAYYGRMALGRCVAMDLGYIGCKTDVLDIMDARCSGKKSCELKLPDRELDSTQPCMKELKSYMDASYKCVKHVKVEEDDCKLCRVSNSITTIKGIIPSNMFLNDRCSKNNCSIVIQVNIGETLDLSMTDFSRSLFEDIDFLNCKKFIEINEPITEKKTIICGRNYSRERLKSLGLFNSHLIEIKFFGYTNGEMHLHNFLINYEAKGCKTPQEWPTRWMRRNENELTFGCKGSYSNKTVYCINGEWSDEISNCTLDQHESYFAQIWDERKFSSGFSIFLILLISTVVAIVIFGIGLIFLRRYFDRRDANKRNNYNTYYNFQQNKVKLLPYDEVATISHDFCTFKNLEMLHEYAEMKEEDRKVIINTEGNYIIKPHIDIEKSARCIHNNKNNTFSMPRFTKSDENHSFSAKTIEYHHLNQPNYDRNLLNHDYTEIIIKNNEPVPNQ